MKKNYCRNVLSKIVAAVFAVFTLNTFAAEQPAQEKSDMMKFLEQDYLLGTWGGLRTDLSKRGVDFEFFYIASNPHNVSGGIKTGSEYQGALLMLMDLDSQKLAGFDGGRFHISGASLHGRDHFSDEHIGDLNKVNLIDFPNASRLLELYYEHKFWDNKVSIKLGQLAVDQDFLIAEFYNSLASINLLNQTFFFPTLAFNVYDVPGFPQGHHALASTPYGAPGVRLRVDATERCYAQVAAYDGFPDQDSGTRVHLDSDEGALLYFEVGYKLNQLPDDTGLPGNIKLGAFYHTDDFADNKSVFNAMLGLGPVTYHSGTYGFYGLIDQTLYREKGKDDPAKQGVVGFFRLTGAPGDRNLTTFGVDGGLVYKGLIPTRDWDSLAVGASYLKMSDDIADGQRLVNSAAPGSFPAIADYEAVVEVTYKAQMTAWWTVQTSVQRVIHPEGSATHRNAWALIIASTIRF
ncbi:MAG: carbohydrate porin [Verrucomicrobia bacterium]|nr:carbohydrate porin [Verrucomicrobiota bacterium]